VGFENHLGAKAGSHQSLNSTQANPALIGIIGNWRGKQHL